MKQSSNSAASSTISAHTISLALWLFSAYTFSWANAPCTAVTTFISPRSQSVNAARDLVAWAELVNIPRPDTYAVWGLTPQLAHSFRFERVTQCFFGDSTLHNKCKIRITGSRAEERLRTDLLADYFGLSTDFVSSVQFRPTVTNAIITMGWYVGLNDLLYGLYFTVHAPLVFARWSMKPRECICKPGSNGYDPGYFNQAGVPRENLLDSFLSFASGCAAPNTEPVCFAPLRAAKINPCALTHTSLAEIQCALGYNVILNDCGHWGLNARLYIPAGNRPTGEFLFEPIVGNGHHWEAGIGTSAHYHIWQDEASCQSAAVYLRLNITHLFSDHQRRSFDLCDKPNSRYMLAIRSGKPITENLVGQEFNGAFVAPIVQFKDEIVPIANLTTLCVNVYAAVQADLALMLRYSQNLWNYSFGFGVWARSCEQIKLRECPFADQQWSIKGDAQLFGFEQTNNTPIPLSISQSRATVHSGTNFPSLGNATAQEIAAAKQNPRIDNPLPAFSDTNNTGTPQPDRTEPDGADQINTSVQPCILCPNDVNLASAADKSVTNKLFAHVGRTWPDRRAVGYVGIGGQIEFGGTTEPTPPDTPDGCFNCALSMWSIWVKGGVQF